MPMVGRCVIEDDWYIAPLELTNKDGHLQRRFHLDTKTVCMDIAASLKLADVVVWIRMKRHLETMLFEAGRQGYRKDTMAFGVPTGLHKLRYIRWSTKISKD